MSKERTGISVRMKRYEEVSRETLTPRMPVIIRIDGRAFHTYTRGFDRPYDQMIIDSMIASTIAVSKDMAGFKAAYHQSDEVSFLLTDWDNHNTQPWLKYVVQKMASVSASMFTASFNHVINGFLVNRRIQQAIGGISDGELRLEVAKTDRKLDKLAVFDGRAFNVPREDVANYFLWRAQDWQRNSLQMMARSRYSHKELHQKGRSSMHEMLHQKGVNWAKDATPQQRNGTFIVKQGDKLETRDDVLPEYGDMNLLLNPYLRDRSLAELAGG